MTDTEQILEENHLVYLTDSSPGIRRKKHGRSFLYFNKSGEQISDEKILARIRKLVLPPAWTNVWIAPKANAHLQATGIDQAGRKQYKYHVSWSESRSDRKYDRLLEFGLQLPVIRKRLEEDLSHRKLDEHKVLAIAVSLMQKTNIRLGNESYKRRYGSYGLSTLRDKHVRIDDHSIRLSFKGKKGVLHDIRLSDRRLARLVKQCRDIPGQELFQYYGEDGERRSIGSGQVNAYLREITACDFTAKDFRTWAGSMQALKAYAEHEAPGSEAEGKRISAAVLDKVSSCLGNTRTVCRKYYVFPPIIEAFERGELEPYARRLRKNALKGEAPTNLADEKVLLSFLRAQRKEKRNSH